MARSVPREVAQVTRNGGQPEAEQGWIITGAGLDPGRARASQKPGRATWLGRQGQLTMCAWTSPSLL